MLFISKDCRISTSDLGTSIQKQI